LGAHAGTKTAENSQADNYYGIKPRKAQSPPPQEKHKEKISSWKSIACMRKCERHVNNPTI
jgi:hypothetical protein